MTCSSLVFLFFFFNDTATTEIYTLSLHDALPICLTNSTMPPLKRNVLLRPSCSSSMTIFNPRFRNARSEEHTSELQSRLHLVCRLLLEKKKNCSPDRPSFRSPLNAIHALLRWDSS